MTTTRSQAAAKFQSHHNETKKSAHVPPKKRKSSVRARKKAKTEQSNTSSSTVERGYIYFFFRPRVEREEAHSLDDVRNFSMLLLPKLPSFASGESGLLKAENEVDMKVLEPGADVIPARQTTGSQLYRWIIVGKKKLPDTKNKSTQTGRKETFWATVTKVGQDLRDLKEVLGPRTYDTKTRGTRHEAPARFVGKGGYAIVLSSSGPPSKRSTHLGYHISHPTYLGEVQKDLGIEVASSFVLQVKNPLAPASAPGQANSKGADYTDDIMKSVFGRGSRGRESYGLRFAPCETSKLLDYEGAQLLFIGAHDGEIGLEKSLGEERGVALSNFEKEESQESIDKIFQELGLDKEVFHEEPVTLGGVLG